MEFRILVLLIVEICAAVGTVIQPFWGLLFLIALTFVRPQDDRPNMAELHFPLVLTLTLIVATLARFNFARERIWFTIRQLWLFIVFFLWMIASAVANSLTLESKSQLDETFVVLLVSGLILIWVNSPGRFKAFLWTLLACGFYYAQLALRNPRLMFEQIEDTHFERLSFRHINNFGNPNYLALFMAIVSFLALAMLVFERRLVFKAALGALFAGFLYVFLHCQSRGATLAFATGLLVFWSMQKRKLLLGTAGVLAVLIGLAAFAPATYLERLQTIGSYQEDASVTGRLQLWRISFGLISAYPILGVGPQNFQRYAFNSQHNSYLQVASEMGIPALLLYVVMLGSGVRSLRIARRMSSPQAKDIPYIYTISSGALAAITAIIVQGFFTGFALREFVYFLLALSYCLRGLAEQATYESPQPQPVIEAPAVEVPA